MKLSKKLITMALAVCVVMSMAVCFADGATGSAGMVAAITDASTGITSANLWTEATNFAPVIVVLFIFAFGYRILRRLLSGGKNGKVKI